MGYGGIEFQLLFRPASEPQRVFTRHELPAGVWGCRSISSRHRRQSSEAPAVQTGPRNREHWIINVSDVGYGLVA